MKPWILASVLALGLMTYASTWEYTWEPVTEENPCDPSTAGTDYWYEVCMNEGEIDLGIQDEADTLTSMGRMET